MKKFKTFMTMVTTLSLSSMALFAAENTTGVTETITTPIEVSQDTQTTDVEEILTQRIEKIKATLAEKLEAGAITQEKYDEIMANIEAGNFMNYNNADKSELTSEMIEEMKAQRIEKITLALAEKLESGEITQEKYDEMMTAIESGDVTANKVSRQLGNAWCEYEGSENTASRAETNASHTKNNASRTKNNASRTENHEMTKKNPTENTASNNFSTKQQPNKGASSAR